MEQQVDLNDVQAVVQIIDVVSRRGAFEGGELAAIGQLRAKFASILEAAQKDQPQEEQAE